MWAELVVIECGSFLSPHGFIYLSDVSETITSISYRTHAGTRWAKAETDFLPVDKAKQSLILLFPLDKAKGSIIGLLQATCIMLNSSWYLCGSLCSSDSKQQRPTGEEPPARVLYDFQPLVTPSLRQDGGEGLGMGTRAERTRVTQSKWSVLWLSL